MNLSQCAVSAVVPVSNLERARDFYQNTLGLQELRSADREVVFSCGGNTSIQIYETAALCSSTAATWEVENIQEAVDELKQAGVVFEQYGGQEISLDDNGAAAWFRDSEDNFLCIHQLV